MFSINSRYKVAFPQKILGVNQTSGFSTISIFANQNNTNVNYFPNRFKLFYGQKWKMSWTKHLTNFNWISFFVRVNIIFNFFRKRNRWWTWIWRFCWRCWRAPWWSTGTWWLFLIWFKVFKLLCFFDFSGFDHFFVNGFRWISQLVTDGLLWSFSCFNLKRCKILTRNFIR